MHHKAHFILGTNYFMFPHQGAILREFSKNKESRVQQYFRGYSPLLSALNQNFLNFMMLNFIFCCPSNSIYIHLKKNQLVAQFIFSVFPQKPLHFSCLSTAHHQEVQPYGYNGK